MLSGAFINGPEVEAFESEIAEYIGVKYSIGLNSGTDALVIGLRALGVGCGDEVITTTFSFFATAEAISLIGAEPVLVDVCEDFNLDPLQVERAITSKTKAIIPVHLFGKSADINTIIDLANKNGLKVLEDCAQCFGGYDPVTKRKLGSIGDLAALSFFPSKNLGAMGDAGMILTNHEEMAIQSRSLRAHGSIKKYYNEKIGYNSRLDTLQAALLRVKLPYLDQWNKERISTAKAYEEYLQNVNGIVLPEISDGHVFHQYTIRVLKNRDSVQRFLTERGVGSMIYYPIPIHQLPVYNGRFPPLPKSELYASQVLSLPMGPGMSRETVKKVSDILIEAICE